MYIINIYDVHIHRKEIVDGYFYCTGIITIIKSKIITTEKVTPVSSRTFSVLFNKKRQFVGENKNRL